MGVYLELILGLAVLIVGAEFLVRGAVSAAQRLGVSALIIGLTIVGWGTSTPELIVSVDAALAGSPGIAVGNVVGSNIANILLILGLAAVVYPITVNPRAIARDAGIALAAAVIFIVLAYFTGVISTMAGIAMLVFLAVMTVWVFRQEKNGQAPEAADLHAKESAQKHALPKSMGVAIAMVIAGLATLIWGADLLVTAALIVARDHGVSETVIGLTLVAVGTSLPELATSVVAALRKQSDVALGNVIGSNIYNILAILGVASLWGDITVPPEIIAFDMWIMLGVTLALLPAFFLGGRIGRLYGAIFLIAYVAYTYYLFTQSAIPAV